MKEEGPPHLLGEDQSEAGRHPLSCYCFRGSLAVTQGTDAKAGGGGAVAHRPRGPQAGEGEGETGIL